MPTDPSTKLSPHFTFGEMTSTSQTDLLAKNRQEAEVRIKELSELCQKLLEPVRLKFGPVKIHSGFRGPALNTRIGGSKNSQHMQGQAADFSVPGKTFDEVFRWIALESGLHFGQAILEGRSPTPSWIHLSLGEPYREKSKCMQLLRFDGKSYSVWKP